MYLLFDIGATKMRIAVASSREKFSEPVILETPKDFDVGLAFIQNTAKELSGGAVFEAVIGGIPGPLNKEKTMCVNANNLPKWNKKPVKAKLQKIFKAPVYLENDTALAGLGEAIFGAGKGAAIVAYITVSTGVNGVRIVDGRIDKNEYGFEIGQQFIDAGVSLCKGCGKGRLEEYISGAATERRFKKKPYEITNLEVWEELAEWLAYGLNNAILHWSPNTVVIGGSMMKKIGIPFKRVNFHLRKILKIYEPPALKRAELGDLGGLYGALAYLKQI